MSSRARERRMAPLHISSGIRWITGIRRIVRILVYSSFTIPFTMSFTAIVYPGTCDNHETEQTRRGW
jgi:hypothetical protein